MYTSVPNMNTIHGNIENQNSNYWQKAEHTEVNKKKCSPSEYGRGHLFSLGSMASQYDSVKSSTLGPL